ncbi:MAG: hypothetical protein AB8G22_17015, partial [Saprospiraceae bacterium]
MKKQFFILPCCLLLFVINTAWGQTDSHQNQVGLQAGIFISEHADLNFSPLAYQNTGKDFGFHYRRQGERSSFALFANYGTGKLTTEASDEFTTDLIQGNLRLQYLQKLKGSSNEQWQFALGGQYQFFINYFDWDNQESFGFLIYNSLDAVAQIDRKLNDKSHLSLSIGLPLVELLVRPSYNGLDEELIRNNYEGNIFKIITNGTFGSFNQFFATQISLAYHYAFSSHLDFVATYHTRF